MKFRYFFLLALCAVFLACNNQDTEPGSNTGTGQEADTTEAERSNEGLTVAFIYGDTVNAKYQFLLDAEAELENERKLIDNRIRRKLEEAEKRAAQLQQRAAMMTQSEMQDAQLELQGLEIEMQQFQEKLASDFRKREMELQREYVQRVDSFLNAYNADGRYDMILNFQQGGNLLWINRSYDITDQVVEGLNRNYTESQAQAEPKK